MAKKGEIVHNYVAELDVVRSTGPDGLTRLADRNNHVHININEIERRGDDDSRDISKYDYQEVLKWKNGLKPLNGNPQILSTLAGGTINFNEPPEDSEYITRSPSNRSRLERSGKKVDFPKFLTYGTDHLKSGLMDITINGDPTKIDIDLARKATTGIHFYNNQFVRVNNSMIYAVKQKLSTTDGSRYRPEGGLVLVPFDRDGPSSRLKVPGFRSRTLEQKLAVEQMISEDTEQSYITGGSGSGKTVVAYAAALSSILGPREERKSGEVLKQIRVFKSNDIIGGRRRELGFLPGTAFDKVYEFMRSFEDAHELIGADEQVPFMQMLLHPKKELQEGFAKRERDMKIGDFYLHPKYPAITVENLQYDRGRTFENEVIFIDEAQNFTPFEIKQLIERVGIGSKIFIVGDPEQVDNPELSPDFNGLVFAASTNYKVHPRVSFMHFDKNFRSQSAEIMRRRRAPRTL